jgi:predicted DNA binding protein
MGSPINRVHPVRKTKKGSSSRGTGANKVTTPEPHRDEGGLDLKIRQLRIELPEGRWYTRISRNHPDTVFDLFSAAPWSEGTSLAVVRTYSSEKCDFAKELRKCDDVISVDSRKIENSITELRIIHKDSPLGVIYREQGVVQRPPLRFCNGVCAWEVFGTGKGITNMIAALKKKSIKATVDPFYRAHSGSVQSAQLPTREVPKVGEKNASGRLVVCRLRFSLPPGYWIDQVTSRHPGTSIDVMGYSVDDDKIILDIRVHGLDLNTWIDELRTIKGVVDVRPLGSAQKTNSLRAVYTGFELTTAVFRLHLIFRTPFTLGGGYGVVVVAGPEDAIRHAIKLFPNLKIKVEKILSTEKDEHPLLTPRQTDIFHRAMAAGYFEVPRRVTLTELASRFGVAISTLSEMLAVIEKKLLQEAQGTRLR